MSEEMKLTYGDVYKAPANTLVMVCAMTGGNAFVGWMESNVYKVDRSDDGNVRLNPVCLSRCDIHNYKSKGLVALTGSMFMSPPKSVNSDSDISDDRTEIYCCNNVVWFEKSPVTAEELPNIWVGDVFSINAKTVGIDNVGDNLIGVINGVNWKDRKFHVSLFNKHCYEDAMEVSWSDVKKVSGFENLISLAGKISHIEKNN